MKVKHKRLFYAYSMKYEFTFLAYDIFYQVGMDAAAESAVHQKLIDGHCSFGANRCMILSRIKSERNSLVANMLSTGMNPWTRHY